MMSCHHKGKLGPIFDGLRRFVARPNQAFAEVLALPSMGEVQAFFPDSCFGGALRATLAFREIAFLHGRATREGGTDLRGMSAARKLGTVLGAGGPGALVEAACERAAERLRQVHAELPPAAVRLMSVLLDPRRPQVYKEGLTCEEPAMLAWVATALLGVKPNPKPKGLVDLDAAPDEQGEAELRWAATPCALPFHRVLPPLSVEEMCALGGGAAPPAADAAFSQVNLVLPSFSPDELESIASAARALAAHVARGIVSAPQGVRDIVTRQTEVQLEERRRRALARLAKKQKARSPRAA